MIRVSKTTTFGLIAIVGIIGFAISAARAQAPAAVSAATPTKAEPSAAVKALIETLKAQIDQQKEAPDAVKKYAKETLLPFSTDPTFVAEAKAQNAKKMTPDQIKKIDEEWMKAEDEQPIQKEVRHNKCAKQIMDIVKKNPSISESFVMDDQGGVVGENNLTSDYWQGDEPKWQNSYAKGKGGVDVGKISLDKSTNVKLQQVSLPLIDADGKVVGAVTWGIAVEKL